MAEKIKVLAISYAFAPWLAPRSTQLQRILNYLSSQNFDITVLHKNVKDLNVPLDHGLLDLTSPNIKTISIKENRNILCKMLKIFLSALPRIPDNTQYWVLNAYWKIRRQFQNFDVILTFSTPISDHLVGLLIKRKRKNIPWIAFFSDPYLENPYLKLNIIERKINKRLEKLILVNADAVIFVNKFTRDKTMRNYSTELRAKTYVIPHAFNEKLYPEPHGSNKKLIIRYLGDFYGSRTPETFCMALRLVAEKIPDLGKKLKVEFYGVSNTNLLRPFIIRNGVEDIVENKGLVGHVKSLALMRSADVLLVIDAPGKENLFLSSKIIEYLGARCPIFMVTPMSGPTSEIAEEIGCKTLEFYDVQEIADQIVTLLNKKEQGTLTVNIPEHVYNRYRVETVAEKYSDLIVKMCNNFNKKISG
ncbi:MAG: glycosyltransferase [Candidatus Latescibacteria bacterium]|nr:glycosyltransferase [Candidatus Latescibacterota bacterium]